MSPAKHAAVKYRGTALAALIVVIAVGLAVYAAAASYDTVAHQAVVHSVSLPRLNPVGIDGGLFGIIILDIATTWAGCPVWWLRLAARVFAAGTVAANASAGWPDPVGVGLRIAAPALFILITEAGRALLLRTRQAAEREQRAKAAAARRAARQKRRGDRIPLMRWLLDFRGTLSIWKRMQLWREPSYAKAVSMELERLAAIEKLVMMYGAGAWQQKAPADLAWMLSAGVRMSEALERVAELTKPEPPALPAGTAGDTKGGTATRSRGDTTGRRKADTAGRRQAAPKAASAAPEAVVPDDVDTQAEALKILADEPDISGSELGRRLGKTPGYGRTLMRRLAPSAPSGGG